ncbi:hypothetical protein D3C80_2209520 [compost metagenome]
MPNASEAAAANVKMPVLSDRPLAPTINPATIQPRVPNARTTGKALSLLLRL